MSKIKEALNFVASSYSALVAERLSEDKDRLKHVISGFVNSLKELKYVMLEHGARDIEAQLKVIFLPDAKTYIDSALEFFRPPAADETTVNNILRFLRTRDAVAANLSSTINQLSPDNETYLTVTQEVFEKPVALPPESDSDDAYESAAEDFFDMRDTAEFQALSAHIIDLQEHAANVDDRINAINIVISYTQQYNGNPEDCIYALEKVLNGWAKPLGKHKAKGMVKAKMGQLSQLRHSPSPIEAVKTVKVFLKTKPKTKSETLLENLLEKANEVYNEIQGIGPAGPR